LSKRPDMCTTDARRPGHRRQSGLSLIELVIAIVVLSVGVVALLIPLTSASRSSGDPLANKQMIAIAESMLEEIELQPFAGTFAGPYTQANRPQFDAVFPDYSGFNTTGIFTIDNVALAAPLTKYNLSVTVQQQTLGTIPGAASYLITVSVSLAGSTNPPVTVSGFRTAYY
jgi:MSHA pilin protein MshD